MTDKKFDPTKSLVMSQFHTVLGHGLEARTKLVLDASPTRPGEVDEVTAALLWRKGLAIYEEDRLPTPVETPEQEAKRLLAEEDKQARRDAQRVVDLSDAEPGVEVEVPVRAELVLPDDLVTWQQDDRALDKTAGQAVTVTDLREIADREEIEVPADANKAAIQRAIVEGRAAKATG